MDGVRRQTHYNPGSPVAPQYDDDATSDYSGFAGQNRKPIHSFDSTLEDGLHAPKPKRSWWDMTIRARRRNDDGEGKEGEALLSVDGKDVGSLADIHARRRAVKRKRRWYNYCICGGVSGLTLL
jgi:hypothetical protein